MMAHVIRRINKSSRVSVRVVYGTTWNHSCLRNRPRGVTVSTLDSESSDRGSNPREVSRQIFKNELKKRMQHCVRQHHRLCFNAFSVRTTYPSPRPWVPFDGEDSRYQMTHHSERWRLSQSEWHGTISFLWQSPRGVT